MKRPYVGADDVPETRVCVDPSRARRRCSDPRHSASAPTSNRSPRGRLRAIVATARPRQWVKNALVVAAAGAAGALGHDDVPGRVALACIAFCLLASGIYAINDVRDVAEDRRHPRKRFRPVAAGELGPRGRDSCSASPDGRRSRAVRARSGRCWRRGRGGYIALTLSYTLVLAPLLVLDIVAIAGGFVLRAVAGGVAAPVTLSRWFVLVVTASAAVRRRRQAPGRADARHESRRRDAGGRCSTRYTPGRLRLLLAGSAGVRAVRVLRVGIRAARPSTGSRGGR